ncbi:MAG: SAM-dependent methyltransferase [Bacteroidales bacterium]|nr:SAM-dependent methyltransferase [Bacteroidales bacterium]
MAGTLYLIPTTLGSDRWQDVIPQYVSSIARDTRHFVVEDIRTARRYLSRLEMPVPISELHFELLNEHSTQPDVHKLLLPLLDGLSVGLISEAGVPAVADPGASLVALAHKHGIKVVPLAGPSSIIMALMASGFNGQNFAFVGYLPIKSNEREHRIVQLEQRSRDENQSQLFIEAPYRNNQLLSSLVTTLKPETLLHISCDLTLPTELTLSQSVKEWKRKMPDLHKRPSIFGIHSA